MSAKCLMVYESLTGNTEKMAAAVAEGIRQAGCEVDMNEMYRADASDLANYDFILLGSSTWGDGDLPDEALDFYDEMDRLNLGGKKAAVFGSCDSSYECYGAAVDLLEGKLRELGAQIVLESKKGDLFPSSEDTEACRSFGERFVKKAGCCQQ